MKRKSRKSAGKTKSIDVSLGISADDYLLLYKGVARDVVAYADDGRTVRFPARILVPYVTRDGVYGRFRIVFSAEGKFLELIKLL